MKRWWAQRPDQILAFEHHLQAVKWGRIVQNGLPRTGGKPPVGRIHFVRSVPILHLVNGVQMLKFDLGAAPTTFSSIPPGRKLRGTQRPPPFLNNAAFPPPMVWVSLNACCVAVKETEQSGSGFGACTQVHRQFKIKVGVNVEE